MTDPQPASAAPVAPPTIFCYRATYNRDVDGDTARLNVEVGFHIEEPNIDFRFYGVNTPELRGGTPEAKALAEKAAAYVDGALAAAQEIRIRSWAQDDFGRWLCTVFYLSADGAWRNLNADLIEYGYGEPYRGPTEPPLPPAKPQ